MASIIMFSSFSFPFWHLWNKIVRFLLLKYFDFFLFIWWLNILLVFLLVLISRPLFNWLGESLITVIPTKVSPNKMIGSFELKAKLVTFGFLAGFFSAKLYAFCIQIVNLDFFKSCKSEHYGRIWRPSGIYSNHNHIKA